jgi:DnaJ family protein A protein 2
VVPHLDGRNVLIKSRPNEVIQPGSLRTVKELGMPFFNAPYKYGNLYIEFDIHFPENLNQETKENLSKIFNEPLMKPETSGKFEQHFLADFKIEDENTHHKGGKGGHDGKILFNF